MKKLKKPLSLLELKLLNIKLWLLLTAILIAELMKLFNTYNTKKDKKEVKNLIHF